MVLTKGWILHGEVQHQVQLPEPFVLVDMVRNPLGASIYGNVLMMLKIMPNFISKTMTPNNFFGGNNNNILSTIFLSKQ